MNEFNKNLTFRKMMDSLTNRLSVLIDQVAENQIEELINHDRMQKERLMMEREQRAKMKISSKKAEDMIYLMKHQPRVGNRDSLISNSISTIAKQNDNQKSSSKPEGRDGGKSDAIKRVATLGSIWGSKKGVLEPASSVNGVDKKSAIKMQTAKSEHEVTSRSTNNKFKKMAKFTVLLNSVKQGRDICTCESLDAKCKIHDAE